MDIVNDFRWDYAKAVQRLYGKSINANIVYKTLNGFGGESSLAFSLVVCACVCHFVFVYELTLQLIQIEYIYMNVTMYVFVQVTKKQKTK